MEARTEHVFDLSGGHLALDFVNTVGGMRGVTPREHLHQYADLVGFARQAGAIGEKQASRLLGEARRRPEEAAVALAAAIALREALYRAFLDRAAGRRPRGADLVAVNAALARALPHRRLLEEGDSVVLGWEDATDLEALLWPVVEGAAQLLVCGEVDRVRVCGLVEEHECSWLFLDRTKGGTRRWCSMESCGNRAKARRHYARAKAGKGGQAVVKRPAG